MTVRVVYVVAQDVRWPAFEWIAEALDRGLFELSFLLLGEGDLPLASHLRELGVPVSQIPYRSERDVVRCTLAIHRYCRAVRADVVHTHFPPAHLAGLAGAWLAGVRVRIQTRHHSTFLHVHDPGAVFYDRLFNRLSTRIVAPSEVVRRVLVEREGVDPARVAVIRHGLDLARFAQVPRHEVEELARRYIPPGAGPVIGVVARHLACKGVQHVIPAFRRLRETWPSAFLVLANARGPDRESIRSGLSALPPGSSVEIPFEENVFALYRLFDLFVHVPVDPEIEAFGLVYVEALSAGVPSVVTLSGIGSEIFRHGVNAWVVEPGSSDAVHAGLVRLLGDPELRASLIHEGAKTAAGFSLRRMIGELQDLYLSSTC